MSLLPARITDDPNAQQAAIEPHLDWLRKLIASKLGAHGPVEDVLQEVSLATVRTANPPVEPQEWVPWIACIALRQCALAHRKQYRSQELASRIASTHSEPDRQTEHDPVFVLVSRERQQHLKIALDQLDEEARWLLSRKYFHGQTYQVLAETLGVEVHVVQYRLAVARKRLRGLLMEMGIQE